MSATDKHRLTVAQKKQNHIESERKRREAIRRSFDALSEVVPDMQGQARSEAVMLQATVAHLQDLVDRKNDLRKIVKAKGMNEKQFEAYYDKAYESAMAGGSRASTSSSSWSSSDERSNKDKSHKADNGKGKASSPHGRMHGA